ncbi:MAG: 50S ribosomal protein L11 methyltransferase [Chloroflexi bacterium]|nr:50S ribosomal protein L11 methyltransferase [Chloroflexota bacterium]
MDWIEVSLSVDGEAAEAVAELLQRYGHQGVAVEQEGIPPDLWDDGEAEAPRRLTVRAYIRADERAEAARLELETALGHLNMLYPMPTPVYKIIQESDWAEAWKAHYHPVRIGRRLLVRPPWAAAPAREGDIEIVLDPGMAFGTGTHPTTQLCLEALEDRLPPGARVLDLGCGSGILAIAAARLGAASVLALDIDPIAVEIAGANIAQNGVADTITVQQGSLDSLITSSRRFDLIVVNILAKVIIAMCDQHLGQVVRPGGLALFSGIIEDQTDDVEAALRKTGLQPTARRQQSDWVLVESVRPQP